MAGEGGGQGGVLQSKEEASEELASQHLLHPITEPLLCAGPCPLRCKRHWPHSSEGQPLW